MHVTRARSSQSRHLAAHSVETGEVCALRDRGAVGRAELSHEAARDVLLYLRDPLHCLGARVRPQHAVA